MRGRQYNENNIEFSKDLRRNMTEAEQAIWYFLRGKNFADYKFRRQQPIGNYIVDFVCQPKRLIIEIDGGQHLEAAEVDKQRDRFLEGRGYRVLRFWNNEVMQNMDGVRERILEELEK